MRGIDLSRELYESWGKAMIAEKFPQYKDRIAVGLVGCGSECFGYDDEISKDHDFEPSFCLWLTEEDDAEIGFALMEAYNNVPKEIDGVRLLELSLGGQNRRGVFTIGEFYRDLIGCEDVPADWHEWFYIPEYALANAVNGVVFEDSLGDFTRIRNGLKRGYPRDVRMKKLAGHLALMAQSGQYNFKRCLSHHEEAAAKLAVNEFINHAFHSIFLLNNTYLPFYKWRFRALREMDCSERYYKEMEALAMANDFAEMEARINCICAEIVSDLTKQNLSALKDLYLERHALEVMQQIKSPSVRSLHLMETGSVD